LVLEIRHGQRHARGNARPGPDGSRAEAVRLEQVVDRPLRAVAVVGVTWWVDPEQPAARAQALRLVERARMGDAVAKRLRDPVAVALETGWGPLVCASAQIVRPSR